MASLKHLAITLCALATPLAAQWSDNFDGYATNTTLDNVGGWFGWDNVPAAAGTADGTFARSAPNSLRCGPGVDAVHPGLGITSGKWLLSAWQYIPTGGLSSGPVYLILNNTYNHGGPYTWSSELQCTGTNVVDDLRPHTPQPLVFDAWVQYCVNIDLDANTVAYYYNGSLISQGVYTVGGGPAAIENIDLFSNGGTCYWDDVALVPAFTDRFDTYAAGTVLDNVGGWFGWDNTPAAAATAVNTFARSGANSLRCTNGTDAVHPSLGITCGKWTFSAWQYIPTGGLATGDVYLIVNNRYNHGGPYLWAMELKCSGTTVVDDLRTNTPQTLIFDQWVEFRAVIDLDANTVSQYYNGALISQGSFGTTTTAPREIQNIDLFSTGGTCYWDDLVIEPTPSALTETYGTGCFGTGGLVPAISANGLPTSGSTTFSVDLSSANANASTVLLFGAGPNSLALGACSVLVSLPTVASAGTTTDASGSATMPLGIPTSVPFGTEAFMQWVVFDPNGAYANTLSFSNGLRIRVGM